MDPEDRKLQIKLAQLNAKLQASLAWAFSLFAAALVWFVFAYQVGRENFIVSVVSWAAAFAFILFAFGWVHRAKKCLSEFEKLH